MAAAVQSGPPPGLGLTAHSSPSIAAMVSRPLPLPVPPLVHHHPQPGMDSTGNGPPNPEVLLALLSRNKNLEGFPQTHDDHAPPPRYPTSVPRKPLKGEAFEGMISSASINFSFPPPPPSARAITRLGSSSGFFNASIPKCGGCQELILDRFILKVLDRTWHAKCLNCNDCGGPLTDKCFARNGQVFCKDDFFKRFGTKCAGCDQGIPPTQVVRRAQDNVYHLQCFACAMCARQLNTGDEFYLMEDRKLVCKPDYEAAKTKDGVCLDGDQPNKRPRTTITAKQLETLKSAYNNSPKPARHVREQLSQDTGLDMRVVQVWFQNRRAKEKRLKKDAGRTKWSQYFRSMKGSSSPRDKLMDDKDDLRVDLDSSFSHSHDLGSNDSYGTVVDMGLTVDGSSPRHGHYLHGGSATPPYLSSSHSPPSGHSGTGHQFPYQSEGLSIYTSLGQNHGSGMLGPGPAGPPSDVSDGSSAQGYPEFPPSPDSWLGENTTPRY